MYSRSSAQALSSSRLPLSFNRRATYHPPCFLPIAIPSPPHLAPQVCSQSVPLRLKFTDPRTPPESSSVLVALRKKSASALYSSSLSAQYPLLFPFPFPFLQFPSPTASLAFYLCPLPTPRLSPSCPTESALTRITHRNLRRILVAREPPQRRNHHK